MAFGDAYTAYVRPTDGLEGVTLAPFQILASEDRALARPESRQWNLWEFAKPEGDVMTPTRHRFVELAARDGRGAGRSGGLT